MIKLKARALLFLPIIALLITGVWMLMPSENDARKYQELLNKSESGRTAKKNPYIATQYREGVTKDIYYRRGEGLLQVHITSDQSKLVFDQQAAGMEILEFLDRLTCVIQKELFYVTPEGEELIPQREGAYSDRKGNSVDIDQRQLKPMQVVRYILADEAVYHYNKERLIADHPTIMEYRLDGHHLPTDFEAAALTMRGVADHVEISFENDDLTFQAQRLKARVFPKAESL